MILHFLFPFSSEFLDPTAGRAETDEGGETGYRKTETWNRNRNEDQAGDT